MRRPQACATSRADEGVRPSTIFADLGMWSLFLIQRREVAPPRVRMLAVRFYRRNLPHMQRDFTPHFITFNTKFREILPEWARDIALASCIHDHKKRYRLRVAVVMPDHVHVILTPLVDDSRRSVISLVEIMKAIKGASAHAINHRCGSHGTVWQEESFDRVIRSSEDLDAKVAYILENPVRKGLVNDWCAYRWLWLPPEENPYAPPPKK